MPETITLPRGTVLRLCYDYLRVVYGSVDAEAEVTETDVEALMSVMTEASIAEEFPYNYVR